MRQGIEGFGNVHRPNSNDIMLAEFLSILSTPRIIQQIMPRED